MGKPLSYVFLFCLLLNACAAPGKQEMQSEAEVKTEVDGKEEELALEVLDEGQEYLISIDDVLDITIYPDKELSRQVTVSREGVISFPLIGEVKMVGMTVVQAEKSLKETLSKDYLVDPQVYVKVEKYHEVSISILGEVNRPGTYQLSSQQGATTLLEAVAKAGGFSQLANMKKIKIMRTDSGQRKVYQVSAVEIMEGKKKDIRLQADDIVVVAQSWF